MDNHLRAWREYFRVTQQDIADRIGTDKTTISKLEAGKRSVSLKWLNDIARTMGIRPEDLLSPPPNDVRLPPAPERAIRSGRGGKEETRGRGKGKSGAGAGAKSAGVAEADDRFSAAHALSPIRRSGPVRDLPVLGVGAGSGESDDVDFELNAGGPIDFLVRPSVLENVRNAYVIYIVGESMSPWRRPGEPVIANPARPAQSGDRVVIQLKQKSEADAIRGYVKELVRTTGSYFVVRQYNPVREFQIERRRVKDVHRVMEAEDLLVF